MDFNVTFIITIYKFIKLPLHKVFLIKKLCSQFIKRNETH